jgi:AcrR family transcriptional regulator
MPTSKQASRRRENTRARLVEASFDVFVEQGPKRVTVDDLVGAAGYTRGAFYSNFSSIEEVFFEVFRLRSESMLAAASAAVDAVPETDFTLESSSSTPSSTSTFAPSSTAPRRWPTPWLPRARA